jgi:hypothetical protein
MLTNQFPIGTKKKQSRAKRTLIGRVDQETGEFIPTDGRGKKSKDLDGTLKPGPVPTKHTARTFYGATYLLDVIGEKLGIPDDLKNGEASISNLMKRNHLSAQQRVVCIHH